jgi:hypothetical protein
MSEQCLAAISSIASTVMAWATLRLLYTILKNARAQTNGMQTILKYSSWRLLLLLHHIPARVRMKEEADEERINIEDHA